MMMPSPGRADHFKQLITSSLFRLFSSKTVRLSGGSLAGDCSLRKYPNISFERTPTNRQSSDGENERDIIVPAYVWQVKRHSPKLDGSRLCTAAAINREKVLFYYLSRLRVIYVLPISSCRFFNSLNDAIRLPHFDISTVESL